MATCEEYNLLQWIARERGQVDGAEILRMDAHLQSCADCREDAELARKISKSDNMVHAEPPESWVREAAAQFESFVPIDNALLIAELISDSYLENAEPLRAGLMTNRKLRFDLPDLQIELLLEYSGPQLEMVIGQLLLQHPRKGNHVQVLELKADDKIFTTKPTELGEFLFSIGTPLTGSPLELKCILKEGPCAVLVIPC